MTTLDTLRFYNTNLARSKAMIARDPTVKRNTDYFNKTVGTIKTSKDFVNNYQVFSYAMTAYGLSDMIYAKAFMQKILDGGVHSSKSIANKMTDPRFAKFVSAFNFGDFGGAATTPGAAANATTTANYVQQTLEEQAGQSDQGAQLALYFQRVAPTITSGYQILADKALSQVVQTTLHLPAVATTSGLDAAAATIESKIKMADLQDPAKVQKLLTRFAAAWDASSKTSTANPATQILSSSGSGGFSQSLLAQIQSAYTRF